MRARFGVPVAVLLFAVYIFAMMTLNKHIGVYDGAVAAQPRVAGASTEKKLTHIPKTTQTLTNVLNSFRSENGLVTLTEDVRLNAVAQSRAIDMVSKQYYAHLSPEGKTFVDLYTQNGLSNTMYSCENLLLSSSADEKQALADWLASPAHKACMSDKLMNRVGVASITFDQETGQKLFVTIFAQQ
ncbi:hypothetical protein KC959_03065 [Candidatus Saccharibacteria bacterium]|nr:hypothetical protein [Candidatus Saccharibacteria bacterium]